jgi:predicted metal-dependent phosphoesterase TrpH
VRRAAEKAGITVLGGMEITTQEEIHLLAIFDSDEDLDGMQNLVYENLPGRNDPQAFGQQYIVDEEDYVTGFNEKLLMGATTLSLERIIDEVHRLHGLAIAAHIDRAAFSIFSQLGLLPDNLKLDAVELSRHYMSSQFNLDEVAFPRVFFSDAHQIGDIGRAYTSILIEMPRVEEIKMALKGIGGRGIVEKVVLNAM